MRVKGALQNRLAGQARWFLRLVRSVFAKSLQLPSQNAGSRSRFFSEEGYEIVEFAFSATILFVFFFGVCWLGMAFYFTSTASEVARQASRWAAVRGADCNNPQITDGTCPSTAAQIRAYASSCLPGASRMRVSVNWYAPGSTSAVSTNQGAGGSVKVVVSYTFASFPLIGVRGFTVSSTSQSVIW